MWRCRRGTGVIGVNGLAVGGRRTRRERVEGRSGQTTGVGRGDGAREVGRGRTWTRDGREGQRIRGARRHVFAVVAPLPIVYAAAMPGRDVGWSGVRLTGVDAMKACVSARPHLEARACADGDEFRSVVAVEVCCGKTDDRQSGTERGCEARGRQPDLQQRGVARIEPGEVRVTIAVEVDRDGGRRRRRRRARRHRRRAEARDEKHGANDETKQAHTDSGV